jgi:hypothetical protein
MTMGGLRTVISSGSYYPTGTTFTFQNGVVPTNSANSTQGFPFVDAASVAAEGAFNTPKYLLWGKPLMGTTTPTYAYPYQETVVLSYPSDYRTARNVQVSYSVTWVDQYSSGNPTNTFTFTFQKYDSLTY